VRRTLAGVIFGVAYICASLAVSGWLLRRVAFDPQHTSDQAAVVLQDGRIKTQITNTIADAVAVKYGLDQATVRQTVTNTANTPQGAALLGQILHDAHAHLIGAQKEPVQITGAQMVLIVRDQVVADMPPVTLPVERVGALDRVRRILGLLIPLTMFAALAGFVIGFVLHPSRAALMRSLAYGMLLLALLIAVLGYMVPRFALPAFSDSIWADVSARLANDSLPLLIGLTIILGGGGVMLLVGTGLFRRRRRWNAPVSTYRYREERQWG
jgi:hypothetical protein